MVTFEQARREPKLRQSYLEQIDFREFTPYVETILYLEKYDPKKDNSKHLGYFESDFSHYDSISARTEVSDEMASDLVGRKSRITVYGALFDFAKTEDDFLSGVVYHEGKHTEQLFFGSFTPSTKLIPAYMSRYPKPLWKHIFICNEARNQVIKMDRDAYNFQLKMAKEVQTNVSRKILRDIKRSCKYWNSQKLIPFDNFPAGLETLLNLYPKNQLL
nr:hypothetical protein [Nanoarchaeum sp.]